MSKAKSRQSSKPNVSKTAVLANGSAKTSSGSSIKTQEKTVAAPGGTVKAGSSVLSTEARTQPVGKVPGTLTSAAQAASKAQSRDAAKYERRQAERQQRYLSQRRARRTRMIAILVSLVVIVAAGSGLTWYFVYQSHAHASTTGSQAYYQEAIYDSDYPPIDNVYCDQLEQSVEHIHAFLSIWIDGKQSALPANVGIPQSTSSGSATVTCYYWLHTHDSSGIIHIESPSSEQFTLGQFLKEWNLGFNSLGFPTELLLNSGWKVWINGKVFNGTLTSVPLNAHNIITVAYNSPSVKPQTTYAWNGL